MTDKIYTIEEIKSISYPILKKYNITDVYLFGSYSRGEATEKSDLDFRITFENKNITYLEYTDLINELEDAFGKEIDCITSSDNMPPKFLFNLFNEEVLMYA